MYAQIKAISYYLPELILSNEDLTIQFPDWSIKKIEEKTGIKNRHIAKEGQLSSDLAFEAAEKLFSEYLIDRQEIDFIILCTQSPDYYLPTTACILQNRLGLKKSIGAFDFNLGCSGFVYGLGICKGLIETGQAQRILLITAETYSKFIHPGDKSIRTIFGDAASATLITGDAMESKIGNFDYGTDGSGAENLIVRNNSLRMPSVEDNAEIIEDEYGNKRRKGDLYMNGAEVFNFSVKSVPQLIINTLEKNKMAFEEIDYFILHQANKYMLEALQKRIKIPEEKFLNHYENCGNTVSSTIPIVLKEAMESKKIKTGDKILLAGFGVGYSWAGSVITI